MDDALIALGVLLMAAAGFVVSLALGLAVLGAGCVSLGVLLALAADEEEAE